MVFPNYPRTVNSVQEILDLADKYQIPLKQCRFFINQDIQEPRAFGIYNDGIKWIVYKNKANGERAIRYQGEDEAYAAQEIWSKFLSEVDLRRTPNSGRNHEIISSSSKSKVGPGPGLLIAFWICCALTFVLLMVYAVSNPYTPVGYYSDGTNIYYSQNGRLYQLNDDEWNTYDGDSDNLVRYEYHGDDRFEDSGYYIDYDSDTDWDDWDSSDTDWDSDW